MKNFIYGFISALVLMGLIYFGYPLVNAFLGTGGKPVAADQYNERSKL